MSVCGGGNAVGCCVQRPSVSTAGICTIPNRPRRASVTKCSSRNKVKTGAKKIAIYAQPGVGQTPAGATAAAAAELVLKSPVQKSRNLKGGT